MLWPQRDKSHSHSPLAGHFTWPHIIPKIMRNVKDQMHILQSINIQRIQYFFPLKNIVAVSIKLVLYSTKKKLLNSRKLYEI